MSKRGEPLPASARPALHRPGTHPPRTPGCASASSRAWSPCLWEREGERASEGGAGKTKPLGGKATNGPHPEPDKGPAGFLPSGPGGDLRPGGTTPGTARPCRSAPFRGALNCGKAVARGPDGPGLARRLGRISAPGRPRAAVTADSYASASRPVLRARLLNSRGCEAAPARPRPWSRGCSFRYQPERVERRAEILASLGLEVCGTSSVRLLRSRLRAFAGGGGSLGSRRAGRPQAAVVVRSTSVLCSLADRINAPVSRGRTTRLIRSIGRHAIATAVTRQLAAEARGGAASVPVPSCTVPVWSCTVTVPVWSCTRACVELHTGWSDWPATRVVRGSCVVSGFNH